MAAGQELFEDLREQGRHEAEARGELRGELRRARQAVLEAFEAHFDVVPKGRVCRDRGASRHTQPYVLKPLSDWL